MSIINQALKKAQREQQLARGGMASAPPAAAEAAAPRKRGQALWIITAALFALSLGATLHAWLASPTAHVGTGLAPARPASAPIPQARPAQLQSTKVPRADFDTVPQQRPTESGTAAVAPARPARVAAARRPVPSAATVADYTARGNALYRQGEYHHAIDMYHAALALDPVNVKARNNLGSAYLQLAMDDRATTAFQEVLRLDSSYSLAYYNLACVQARAGDAQGAAAFLRQAIAIAPEARAWARTDDDFARVRNTLEFRQLLGS